MPLHKFKYISPGLVELLLQQEIRFTQPDALNDPFEMKRFRETLIQEKPPELWDAPAAATRTIIDRVTNHPTESPLAASFSALQTLLQANAEFLRNPWGRSSAGARSPGYFASQTPAAPPSADEIQSLKKKAETFVKKMDRYGILSMTGRNDDLLMWAHYADEHRGAVFEIDVENEEFGALCTSGEVEDEDADEWRNDVEYLEQRTTPPVDHAAFIGSFFRKSPHWKYEEEYRIIRRLEKATRISDKTDMNGHGIYTFPLPAASMKRVIFGARFADASSARIARLVRGNPELAHIELGQATLHLDFYSLQIGEYVGTGKPSKRKRPSDLSIEPKTRAVPPQENKT